MSVVKVPTVVRDDETTLDARVVPVKSAAADDEAAHEGIPLAKVNTSPSVQTPSLDNWVADEA